MQNWLGLGLGLLHLINSHSLLTTFITLISYNTLAISYAYMNEWQTIFEVKVQKDIWSQGAKVVLASIQ